jgi:hypothetical protein
MEKSFLKSTIERGFTLSLDEYTILLLDRAWDMRMATTTEELERHGERFNEVQEMLAKYYPDEPVAHAGVPDIMLYFDLEQKQPSQSTTSCA